MNGIFRFFGRGLPFDEAVSFFYRIGFYLYF